jgi:uncharacterized RDD family membrane protein YckC
MIAKRFMAFIVDGIIYTIPFAIYYEQCKVKGADGEYSVHGPVPFIILFGSLLIYNVVLEHYCSGQTLGKKLHRLRVIKMDGAAVTHGDSIKRHLLDPIELFLLPFISFFSMVINRKGRRIGDLLAGTLVVSAHPETTASQALVQ